MPGAAITVVRLRAAADTLAGRVRGREVGAGLNWNLRRSAELAAQMERDQLEDLVVETDGRSIAAIAREVLDRCAWAGVAHG